MDYFNFFDKVLVGIFIQVLAIKFLDGNLDSEPLTLEDLSIAPSTNVVLLDIEE